MSDRQWRDVPGVLRLQAGRLDRGYLESGARRAGPTVLLDKALGEAGRSPDIPPRADQSSSASRSGSRPASM